MWRCLWLYGTTTLKSFWWFRLSRRWILIRKPWLFDKTYRLFFHSAKSTTIWISFRPHAWQTILSSIRLHPRASGGILRLPVESPKKRWIQRQIIPGQQRLTLQLNIDRSWFNIFERSIRWKLINNNEKIFKNSNNRSSINKYVRFKYVLGRRSYNVFRYPCIRIWSWLFTWCLICCWSCYFVN